MSLWQFNAAVLGVQRANAPADGETATAPSVADFETALQTTVLN